MRNLPSFFLFLFSCGHVLLQFLCNLQQYCDKILSLLAVRVMTLDRKWFYSSNIVIIRDLPSMLAVRAMTVCNLQQYIVLSCLPSLLAVRVMTLDRKWFYSSFRATYSNVVIIRDLSSLLALSVMTLDRKWFYSSFRATYSICCDNWRLIFLVGTECDDVGQEVVLFQF